jgi:hypothetical protein
MPVFNYQSEKKREFHQKFSWYVFGTKGLVPGVWYVWNFKPAYWLLVER